LPDYSDGFFSREKRKPVFLSVGLTVERQILIHSFMTSPFNSQAQSSHQTGTPIRVRGIRHCPAQM